LLLYCLSVMSQVTLGPWLVKGTDEGE
jgi:hypothetical protein